MRRKELKGSLCPHVYGILGLVLLNFLLFGDLLFGKGGRVLSSDQTDLFLHFTAWREFAFQQLRQGHLVLWNPHYLCGTPFLGGFESAILYPPNWVCMFLPINQALNFGIVLHVFLAGLFTYLWAAYRKLAPLACFVAGVVFMWGGAYFLHLTAGHLPNLCAMVWAPLIFWALDGWMEEMTLGWVLLGTFAVSMQILAGHPQYVYFTAIVGFFYTLLNLKGRNRRWRMAGGFAAFYGAAGLLTAVQLWTGLEAIQECGRNMAVDLKVAGSFSMPPENLLTLAFPCVFGNLENHSYWGRWFFWEVNLFISVTGFFLVVFALGGREGLQRKWAFTTAVLAFVFSLGIYGPFFQFFYDYVPGFQGLRGFCKFGFLTGLFLALLAGIGFDRLLKSPFLPKPILRWLIFAGAGLLALGGMISLSVENGPNGEWAHWFTSIHWLQKTVLGLAERTRDDYVRQSGLYLVHSLWLGGGTCIVLSGLLWLGQKRRKFIYAVAGLLVLEIFTFARVNRPTFELSSLEKKFEQVRDLYRNDPGDYRVYGTGSDSLAAGGFDIWEDEPMVLGAYGRFVCQSQGLREDQLFSVLPIFKKFGKIFGLIRLKYLVTMNEGPIELYRTPFELAPRMSLVDGWEAIPDDAKRLDSLLAPGFDFKNKILLEKDPWPLPVSGGRKGTVSWKDLSTEKIEVEADTPHPTLLLVTDNYSRGWRATALPDSGQSHYEVLRGDYFLRAVPLSKGHHHLLMEYRPPVFVIGKWISIISCLLYVGILVFRWRRSSFLSKAVS